MLKVKLIILRHVSLKRDIRAGIREPQFIEKMNWKSQSA